MMPSVRLWVIYSTYLAAVVSAGAQNYAFTNFAGQSGLGSVNGTGSAARFSRPTSVAVDSIGNLFVADPSNQVIRKITLAGVVTTFAGEVGKGGTQDGIGNTARFITPRGIAIDGAGNLYVVDQTQHAVRKITPSGVVTTLAGSQRGSLDGTGTAARFDTPLGIASDTAGNLFVADAGSETIRKVTPSGIVTTIAGIVGVSGNTDGSTNQATFNGAIGLAVDTIGRVYVSEAYNGKVRIISPNGIVSTLCDSAGTPIQFSSPWDVEVDAAGNVYVPEEGRHTIKKITPSGTVITLAGLANVGGSNDGTGEAARFYEPESIAIDTSGTIFVVDSGNNLIRKVTFEGAVSTLAGQRGTGSDDGIGTAARFVVPDLMTCGLDGSLYVSDRENYTIRKIARDGTVTTVAGSAGSQGNVDAKGSAARFGDPQGIAVDASGNVYVADQRYDVIRKIAPDGTVSRFAGMASSGNTDGPALSAKFNNPQGLALDSTGNLYIADSANHTIRKIAPSGLVTTFAGTPGVSGTSDGSGNAARFNTPCGLAIDRDDNLYIADYRNHAIRKVSPSGVVITLAGLAGTSGFMNGTGTLARFSFPRGIGIDGDGNVFVADRYVRKISPSAAVTTLTSTQTGYSDGVWTSAMFSSPEGIAVDPQGVVYVSDKASHTVRRGVRLGDGNPICTLANLSVRADMASGQRLIAGFVMSGGTQEVLIRAVGPGLEAYLPVGYPYVADPRLELFDGNQRFVASNETWGGSANLMESFSRVGAFPLPLTSTDAVLLPAINGQHSAHYIATGTGVGIIEAYDVEQKATPRLVNVSARYPVDNGPLIAGFVLRGSGVKTLLVRAVGPTLVGFGVNNALSDPKLEIVDGDGRKLAENDNWDATGTTNFTGLPGFELTAGSKDAALLISLPAPGRYSAIVSSSIPGGTGEALVEVYEVE